MGSRIRAFLLILVGLFMPFMAMAQGAAPGPVQPADIFAQVLDYIHQFGGLNWELKISGIIVILLSAVKTTALTPIWDKLGKFKVWAGPILALIAGNLILLGNHQWSVPGVLAYLSAGVGAIAVHELLDSVKAIPGLGSFWVTVIGIISDKLGGDGSAAIKAEQAKAA